MTDLQRLDKLKHFLRYKKRVHTNPVDIEIADLEWLIEQAEKAITRQGVMEI